MDRHRTVLALGAALLLVVATSGCRVVGPSGAEHGPRSPEPCASHESRQFGTAPVTTEPTTAHPITTGPTTARPTTAGPATREPTVTKLAYRGEEMPDGSVRMTVGDVDAAPAHPDAVRVFDYRRPDSSVECDRVQITTVSGWWCTTTVEPIDVEGPIVLGDAEPRARIGGEGFATRCRGKRPGELRQVSQLERDSWSGWRDYSEVRYTPWTGDRRQTGEAVWEPCPQGRVGTYDYQLRVRVEIDGVEVGDSPATSAPVRTDCGTGVS